MTTTTSTDTDAPHSTDDDLTPGQRHDRAARLLAVAKRFREEEDTSVWNQSLRQRADVLEATAREYDRGQIDTAEVERRLARDVFPVRTGGDPSNLTDWPDDYDA